MSLSGRLGPALDDAADGLVGRPAELGCGSIRRPPEAGNLSTPFEGLRLELGSGQGRARLAGDSHPASCRTQPGQRRSPMQIRRLPALRSGAAGLGAAGFTSPTLAFPSSSVKQAALAQAAPTIVNSASPTTGPVPTTCAGPIVNANSTVSFCLTAPQAANVDR